MNLSSLLGILSIAGWVMVIAGAGVAITSAAQKRNSQPGIVLALVGLLVGVLFFAVSAGIVLVGPTEVAVVFQSVGGDGAANSLWPNPLGPGVHLIVPIINQPILYSTERHTYTMSKTTNEGAKGGDDSIATRTLDGQQVYVDVSISYNIDPSKANLVHIRWKDRFQEEFVRPLVRGAIRDVVAGYNVDDVNGGKRAEIQSKIYEFAIPKFLDNGLQIGDLTIRNITFSDEFIKAIEARKVAQQQAEQALQEANRQRTLAKGQADAAVTSAKGEADANIEKAKGDAQAIAVRAAADAKALALINEQISKNPLLIQWRYIEKLAGQIRLVLIPSNSPYLIDPQNTMGQTKASNNAESPVATQSPTTP